MAKPTWGGVIIQFSMMQPEYSAGDGRLVSHRAATIKGILQKRYPDMQLEVSANCLEGKKMFDELNDNKQR